MNFYSKTASIAAALALTAAPAFAASVALPLPAPARPRPQRHGTRRPPRYGVTRRFLGFLVRLPQAGVVDRLVRGRMWIPIVGFLLIGLVAVQVSMLRLNAQIGQDVERGSTLERRNGELGAEVVRLASGERIQAAAAKIGMRMPPAGKVRYVTVRGARDARRALATMRAPGPIPAVPQDVAGEPAAPAPEATQEAVSSEPAAAATPEEVPAEQPAATTPETGQAPADTTATPAGATEAPQG